MKKKNEINIFYIIIHNINRIKYIIYIYIYIYILNEGKKKFFFSEIS